MFQVPSLFEIARQKGYRITYVDNQHVLEDQAVRNYIDDKEASLINEIYSPMQPGYARDLVSIEFINRVLKNSSKNFIFVNKVGAHFPYEMTINPLYRTNSKLTNYSISLQQNSIQFLDKLSKSLTTQIRFCFTHQTMVKTFLLGLLTAIQVKIFLQRNILFRLLLELPI